MARPQLTAQQLTQRSNQKVTALRLRAQQSAATLIASITRNLSDQLFTLFQSDSTSVRRFVTTIISQQSITEEALRAGLPVDVMVEAIISALQAEFGNPPRSFTFTFLQQADGSFLATVSWS